MATKAIKCWDIPEINDFIQDRKLTWLTEWICDILDFVYQYGRAHNTPVRDTIIIQAPNGLSELIIVFQI